MKPLATALVLGALALNSNPAAADDKPDLSDPIRKVSYAIGVDIARNLTNQDLGLDPKLVAAGISDGYAGKVAVPADELQKTLMEFQKTMQAKMQAKAESAGSNNKTAGAAFLAENAKKDGVKTTASGLQYKVIKSGSGRSPTKSDTVKVNYHGTLIDGTVFDSSVDRGEPIEFGVGQVIAGWTEALQLMKEGDKWKLFIPSDLAYGPRSMGPKIGPNSTLIFEVELLAVKAGGGQ